MNTLIVGSERKFEIQNLQNLSDDELDRSLKSLVKKENEVLSEILLHIREVDLRRLYLKKSFGSLFDYLTKQMGYSSGPAQRRIDAARLSKEVPSLIEDLKAGNLNLSQVSLVQQLIRQKKMSYRKRACGSEQASNSDLFTSNDRNSLCKTQPQAKTELLDSLKNKSIAESQVIVSKALDIEMLEKPKIKRQADESVRLEISFSKEQWDKLEKMKSLLSHSLPTGTWDQVLEYVADRIIASKTKARIQNGAESPRDEVNEKDKAKSSDKNGENQMPAKFQKKRSFYQLRKDLLSRHSSCQHRDKLTNQVCTSTWQLQVDHIQPKWAGGSDEIENLRVLCAQHNRLRYREQAGMCS